VGNVLSRIEGWDMAFKARGRRPRNALCHERVLGCGGVMGMVARWGWYQ